MPTFVLDTHVHIYPFYDLQLFFRSADKNLKKLEAELGGKNSEFVLCLTERHDCHFFREHRDKGVSTYGEFTLSYDNTNSLLKVSSSTTRSLTIVSGRQILSKEGLEVLSLGSDEAPLDGEPLKEIISKLNERKVVVVLPWSFGKWMGKRGSLIGDVIQDKDLGFILGDPGHRPKILQVPEFKNSLRSIVRGSDPLPIRGDEIRVGQYGIASSAADVKEVFMKLSFQTDLLGKNLNLLSSIFKQVRLRFQL